VFRHLIRTYSLFCTQYKLNPTFHLRHQTPVAGVVEI
jgi:hypothetical protein